MARRAGATNNSFERLLSKTALDIAVAVDFYPIVLVLQGVDGSIFSWDSVPTSPGWTS